MSYSRSIVARPAFMRRSWLRFTDILTCMCNHTEAQHLPTNDATPVNVLTSAAWYAGGGNPAILVMQTGQSDSKPNEGKHSNPRHTSRQGCKRVQQFKARLLLSLHTATALHLCIHDQSCNSCWGCCRPMATDGEGRQAAHASKQQATLTLLLTYRCVEYTSRATTTLWLLLRSPTCLRYSSVYPTCSHWYLTSAVTMWPQSSDTVLAFVSQPTCFLSLWAATATAAAGTAERAVLPPNAPPIRRHREVHLF